MTYVECSQENETNQNFCIWKNYPSKLREKLDISILRQAKGVYYY
jgi:hypothetical protein